MMFGFDKNKLDSVASSNCGTHLLLWDSLIKNKLDSVASRKLRDSLIKNKLGRVASGASETIMKRDKARPRYV